VVGLGEHNHHNYSCTVGPEVDDNLVESTVLAISDATSLEYKVTNGVVFRVLFDSENNRELHDSCLETIVVVADVKVENDAPEIDNNVSRSSVHRVQDFKVVCSILLF